MTLHPKCLSDGYITPQISVTEVKRNQLYFRLLQYSLMLHREISIHDPWKATNPFYPPTYSPPLPEHIYPCLFWVAPLWCHNEENEWERGGKQIWTDYSFKIWSSCFYLLPVQWVFCAHLLWRCARVWAKYCYLFSLKCQFNLNYRTTIPTDQNAQTNMYKKIIESINMFPQIFNSNGRKLRSWRGPWFCQVRYSWNSCWTWKHFFQPRIIIMVGVKS